MRNLSAFVFVLCLSVLLAAPGALARPFNLISAFPDGFIYNREFTERFVRAVEEETDGAIAIRLLGPAAAPAFDQFEPTQAGVFDFLVTTAAYHSGAMGEGLALDAVPADPRLRRTSGYFAAVAEHYESRGLKLLAAAPTGSKGFHFLLRKPLTPQKNFDGLKLRGTEPYHHLIRTLGGTPVVLGPGDVYVALQRGVVDGAAWGVTGALDFKWHEVTCCMTRPLFGQVNVLLLMNLEQWRKLSAEQQMAIENIAAQLEEETVARFDALAEIEFAALEKEGVITTKFSDSAALRLDQLWADGVWGLAIKRSGESARRLREMAEEAGLVPQEDGAP